MGRTQQLLNSLQQKHLAPIYMISAMQAELTNLDSIYTYYKPLILTATQLLRRERAFNGVSSFNKHTRRSLLTFLGDALSWFTETATTQDVNSIKNRVNQLIAMQHEQQETLVHIISVLNVTRYAMQGEQTMYHASDGCIRKDTSWCHHALQYYQFILHQPELPTNCASHLLHSGKCPILHDTSHHACNGLHRCSHNWYTITSCTTSRRSQEDVNTHWRGTTFNHAFTSFIRGYTPLL